MGARIITWREGSRPGRTSTLAKGSTQGALFTLVRRWRSGLATLLGTVIAGDACLTLLQALAYNIPRAHGLVDWLIIGVAVLGPSLAAVLLFWARGHATLEPG